MTFKVGDFVVRKRDEDNAVWLNDCKYYRLDPFVPYQVQNSNLDGHLWLVGHPSTTVWIQDRFDFAYPPDKPLEDYM